MMERERQQNNSLVRGHSHRRECRRACSTLALPQILTSRPEKGTHTVLHRTLSAPAAFWSTNAGRGRMGQTGVPAQHEEQVQNLSMLLDAQAAAVAEAAESVLVHAEGAG